jgi:8-oxo-dGTP pyrophosphatase MutT (NUDIX family)
MARGETMSNQSAKCPYETLKTRDIYHDSWVHVREDHVVHPNGQQGHFTVINMNPGVCVLPVTADHMTYLVKQYRHAISQESIELVSGAIEKGETPLAAAKREMQEEIGLEAKEWIDLGIVNPLTTLVNVPNHMFLARQFKENKGHRDPTEPLEVVKVPLAKLIDMVMCCVITHAPSCVLILKAERCLNKSKR